MRWDKFMSKGNLHRWIDKSLNNTIDGQLQWMILKECINQENTYKKE